MQPAATVHAHRRSTLPCRDASDARRAPCPCPYQATSRRSPSSHAPHILSRLSPSSESSHCFDFAGVFFHLRRRFVQPCHVRRLGHCRHWLFAVRKRGWCSLLDALLLQALASVLFKLSWMHACGGGAASALAVPPAVARCVCCQCAAVGA